MHWLPVQFEGKRQSACLKPFEFGKVATFSKCFQRRGEQICVSLRYKMAMEADFSVFGWSR